MTRSEKSIQTSVVNYAKRKGVTCIKLGMAGAFGSQGWPDFLLLYKSYVVFVEFKAPGNKPTALQLAKHAELNAQGFCVRIVDNVDWGREIVDILVGLPE